MSRKPVTEINLIAGGPFRATELWNEMINTLQAKVVVKRRRVHRQRYENCFTGADAVDVVLRYLLEDKHTFPNKKITRDNAFKVTNFIELQLFLIN